MLYQSTKIYKLQTKRIYVVKMEWYVKIGCIQDKQRKSVKQKQKNKKKWQINLQDVKTTGSSNLWDTQDAIWGSDIGLKTNTTVTKTQIETYFNKQNKQKWKIRFEL